jgi:hypothetical protein
MPYTVHCTTLISQALLEPLLLEGDGRLGSGVGPGAEAAARWPVSKALLNANKLLEMAAALEVSRFVHIGKILGVGGGGGAGAGVGVE